MKITTLELGAFKSFQNITIPVDAPRVLFSGLNASGKSSIAQAIKWSLLGRCDATDRKGAGSDRLVPQGTNGGVSVALELDQIGRVARLSKNGSSSFGVSGFTGQPTTQHEALFQRLETTPAFLEACLDTGAFLSLHHSEAKALVLSLLNVQIRLAEDDPKVYSLDELDAMYTEAFSDRKDAKIQLRTFNLPLKPAPAEFPTIPRIEDQLAVLRGKAQDVAMQGGSVAGRRLALEQLLLDIEAGSRTYQHKLSEDELDAQILEREERLAIMEAEAAPEFSAEPPPVGDPKRIIFLKDLSESLGNHVPGEGCVLDPLVPCKTPKLAFKKRAKELRLEMDALPSAPVQKPQAVPVNPLTQLRKDLEQLQGWKRRYEEERRLKDEAAAEIKRLEQALADLPDTSVQDEELATLKGRIQKGESLLQAARTYWTSLDAYDKAVEQKTALEANVARLETLCEALGPNGVRIQALTEAIGQFEAAVNVYTAPFGWEVKFQLDPWQVFVNGRPVETYSESQCFRVGIALQIAIAAVSGLKFAVVDRLDMLTTANRAIVTRMLLQAPLDQVFVLGSREAEQPLPKLPGVLAYRLDLTPEGRTIVVERSAA